MKSRTSSEREINYAISQVIRRRRVNLMSQNACAELAGMANSALCQMELGKHKVSLQSLLRLSIVLKTSPAEILDEALVPIIAVRES